MIICTRFRVKACWFMYAVSGFGFRVGSAKPQVFLLGVVQRRQGDGSQRALYSGVLKGSWDLVSRL